MIRPLGLGYPALCFPSIWEQRRPQTSWAAFVPHRRAENRGPPSVEEELATHEWRGVPDPGPKICAT